MTNTSFYFSNFLLIQDHLAFVFERLFFDENLLINSNIIEIVDGENENKVSNCSEFTIYNNKFLNHSFFLNHQSPNQNETLIFFQMKIQNNLFQNVFWQIQFKFKVFLISFIEIYSLQNTIEQTLLQIFSVTELEQSILLDNFWVCFNNLDSLFFLESQQNFIVFEGKLNITLKRNYFLNNLCFFGPCGFLFISNNPSLFVFLLFSIFSNNLAFYSNSDDIPSCVLSLRGTINIFIFEVLMQNNTIHQYTKEKPSSSGDKGNPCLISDDSESTLSILNSSFYENAGYGISSCIFFRGYSFAIINSTIERHISSENKKIFAILLDCFVSSFTNVSFLKGKGGSFSLDSEKEIVFFTGKDILISENTAFSPSLVFLTQKFFIIFQNLKFISNKSYFTTSFLYIYNSASDYENHILYFYDSLFLNNEGIKSENGLFQIVMMGCYFNITNSFFFNNIATGADSKGGVLHATGEITGFLTFFNCTFVRNFASSGGIVFILLGSINFDSCILEYNSVGNLNGNFL